MKLSMYFASPFLRGADFEDRQTRVLTIASVEEEEVGKERETKVVVHFRETEKGWVLNKTNWRTIENAYGDTADWPGRKVELFGAVVEFAGETSIGIRVRAPKARPAPPSAAPIDDSIPF